MNWARTIRSAAEGNYFIEGMKIAASAKYPHHTVNFIRTSASAAPEMPGMDVHMCRKDAIQKDIPEIILFLWMRRFQHGRLLAPMGIDKRR